MTISESCLLVNNAYGSLGIAHSTSDTTLTFTTGHGARFPAVASGQVLSCCILNSNNVLEEVQVTLHTAGADTATMVRGANGSTAKAWSAGDRVEARISSDVLKRLQQEALKEITITTADAGATYTGSISPTGYGLVTGLVYALKLATTNSGTTPTINLSSLGAVTVVLDGGAALVAGQMPKHGLYKYDGTNFVLMNAVGSVINALLDISGASGGQIKFPATQNASANANTLDDYEEGTWTPAIQGDGTAGTQTYSTQSARYTKTGRTVFVEFRVAMTAKDAATAGSITISGLPFATGLAFGSLSVGRYSNIDFPAGTTHLCLGAPGIGAIVFYLLVGGDNTTFSFVNAALISATTEIEGSGSYTV